MADAIQRNPGVAVPKNDIHYFKTVDVLKVVSYDFRSDICIGKADDEIPYGAITVDLPRNSTW